MNCPVCGKPCYLHNGWWCCPEHGYIDINKNKQEQSKSAMWRGKGRKMTRESFVITTTRCGCTLRWKHNNRAIKTFYGGNCQKRANRFIEFLLEWYTEHPLNTIIPNSNTL